MSGLSGTVGELPHRHRVDFLCGSELLVMGQRHRSRKRCRRKLGRAGGYRSVPEIRAVHLAPDLSIMARQLCCRCYKMTARP